MKLTFRTWQLIVCVWLLGSATPFAPVNAQIPPASSSASSLDLALHAQPSSLTHLGTSPKTKFAGDGSDCDRRDESKSAPRSDPGSPASTMNQFPGSGFSKGSGSATEGLFGIRYGYTGRVWNVYVKARPGFIYYPKTTSFPTGHEFVSLSRFAVDCGTTIEMKASKRSAFRFDAGTTFVRYLQGLDPRQAPVSVISPTYIATQGNFQVATGYIFRF